MRLTTDDCWHRLGAAPHGVLCTARRDGAIDAVPVCFAVVDDAIVTPVDSIKEKKADASELGRVRNLEVHPEATLLCEHWDADDWSHLWWVRAHLVRVADGAVSASFERECNAALRQKYTQYRDAASPFDRLLVFDVTGVTGWGAGPAGIGDDV